MAAWHRKVVIDTIKTAIPFQNTLRRMKRRVFSYGTDASNDGGLFEDSIRMVAMLRAGGTELEGKSVLEFGSGWNPILPLIFRLAGSRHVTLTDRERLLDTDLLKTAIRYIDQRRDELAVIGLDSAMTHVRLMHMQHGVEIAADLEHALTGLGLDYSVPFDSRTVQTRSCDIIVSRAVLEHVSEPLLRAFITEFRRILKPDGTMCHFIDMSDHWEHIDKSISRVNFLQYSDWLFQLTCLNPQNYQNRLRHSHFHALFEAAGFTVVRDFGDVHGPSLEALKTLPLSPRFADLPHQDLATITAHMVMKNGQESF